MRIGRAIASFVLFAAWPAIGRGTEVFRDPTLAARLERGERFKSVYLITHPFDKEFAEKVAQYLSTEPAAQAAPRIILASENFPVASPKLTDQASVIWHSKDGSLGRHRVSADEIHLMGGFYAYCFKRTFGELLWQIDQSTVQNVRVVIHAALVYTEIFRSLRHKKLYLLQSEPPMDWARQLFQYTMHPFLPAVPTECGGALSGELAYELRDRAGKTVRIEFTR